jgi:hypothetical protein
LDILLTSKYGPQWLTWDPETIWSEIEVDFGVNPSVHTRNKVNALKTMHVVDAPWTEWEVFAVACQALNNNIPDFRILQKPTPAEIITAVDIMAKVKKREFSEEVGRFVAACFLDAGIVYLPPPVGFAQRYASMPRYKCTTCGKVDSDDDNEICDSCGAPQRYLEKTLRHDPAPVKSRYKEVMADGANRDYWLMDDTEDVQVAKLIVAKRRSSEAEAAMKTQLEAVRHG